MNDQNSGALQTEIESLEQQRDRLQSDISAANRVHEEAQNAVLQQGTENALDDVTVAHARVSALGGALAKLSAEIAAKRDDLNRVMHQEHQEKLRTEIAEREKRRTQAGLDYITAREQANTALVNPLNAMLDAEKRFSAETTEIERLYSSLDSPPILSRRRPEVSRPKIAPFGYEIDMAYVRLTNMAQKEEAERTRQLLREREQARRNKKELVA